jgi:Arc/MetJ family transcription regulator
MRTNIIIDDELMKKAMIVSGSKTKKATVEKALSLLIRMKNQEAIRALKGKLNWEGDLNQMRSDI